MCKKITRQRVLFSYVNRKVDFEIPTEYTLTECQKCAEPGLFMREDEGWGFLPGTDYHLWRGEKRKLGGIVPYEASEHYRRAQAYEQEAKWDAVVLEVGRTLEAIVKTMEPSAKNLGDGINKLSASNMITADLKEWATELRILRNLSAHASGKSFSEREAEAAFDFLDAIVETIFWTRRKFTQFRSTRVQAEKKTAGKDG